MESTYWRPCDADGSNCHCDLRLELMDCAETYSASIVMKLQIALSIAVTLGATGILTFRLVFRGQKLFDYRGGRPQPQPILSMYILGITFNLLRMLHAIFLLTEVVQSKIVRSFIFDLSWQFGFGTFAAYLIGIATAVFDSNTVVTRGWKFSQSLVTKIGVAFLVLPVITNSSCSVLIGYFAEKNNPELADIFTRLLYTFWSCYCFALSSCVVYAGFGLIRLLNSHLRAVIDGRQYDVFKTGRVKVRIIMTVTVLCLMAFFLLLVVYMSCKPIIQASVPFNLIICIIWNFAGPIATFFIEITFLLDPKMLKGPTFSATGSSFGQRTDETTIEIRGSLIDANKLPGAQFLQRGHELKVYNQSQSSVSSDVKHLMYQ
ncbi:unnamed protein product [Umbelopsis ramanniana]